VINVIDKIILFKYGIVLLGHWYTADGHGYFVTNIYRFNNALIDIENAFSLEEFFLFSLPCYSWGK